MSDPSDAATPAVGRGPERSERHDRLRQQVAAAIEEIASMRCPDPAAVDAFLTARLALHTLREVWLPHI